MLREHSKRLDAGASNLTLARQMQTTSLPLTPASSPSLLELIALGEVADPHLMEDVEGFGDG
eukprot:m.300380 g.300380  ORF g.300380 m.300380 type:complete len:62 (-) comp14432_c0_seq1:1323-1508(-)